MSMQLAKLYLRGSLVNITMKNLTEEQKITVEEKLEELMNNKDLQGCKNKFCETLANTVGGDYQHWDAALNDFRVALYRAIVYILYHKPNPKIFDDPQQVKKLFKNFAYQYMRQILNENKIPHSSIPKQVKGTPYQVAQEHIAHILCNENVDYNLIESNGKSIIHIPLHITPRISKKIHSIRGKYERRGVAIHINDDNIVICKGTSDRNPMNVKLEKRLKIKISNLDTRPSHSDSNCDTRYDVEHKIFQHTEHTENLGILELSDILPDSVRDIFHLIVNTPDDFVQKYKTTKPNKKQMAEYLGINASEVNRGMKKLKLYCCCYG